MLARQIYIFAKIYLYFWLKIFSNSGKLKQNYQIDSVAYKIGFNYTDSLFTADSSFASDSLGKETMKPIVSVLAKNRFGAEEIIPESNKLVNFDWITIHILLILIVVAWVNTFYSKRIKQVFTSFFSVRNQTFMSRDGNLFKERISIALLIVFLFSYSLFFYLILTQLFHIQMLDLSGFKYFSFLFLIVLISWILKNLILTFIGVTFKNDIILDDFMLTNFIFNIVSSVFLLPLLIVAIYLPSDLMVEMALYFVLIVFIYRMFRQLLTGWGAINFSWFNRILYLCTFEIIPILIVIKLVMSNLK